MNGLIIPPWRAFNPGPGRSTPLGREIPLVGGGAALTQQGHIDFTRTTVFPSSRPVVVLMSYTISLVFVGRDVQSEGLALFDMASLRGKTCGVVGLHPNSFAIRRIKVKLSVGLSHLWTDTKGLCRGTTKPPVCLSFNPVLPYLPLLCYSNHKQALRLPFRLCLPLWNFRNTP